MTRMRHVILTAAMAGFCLMAVPASALPFTSAPGRGSIVVPAQLFQLFVDEDDGYIHDRHYDWNQYRNSTSRKERVRDYYRMQKEAEKDYWRAQKNMQKQMIKRQRGW
ncbi:hypothetical protein [Microvirga lenta]|uniref:hypothetical protein n=1 Tax=Microvirga lenta TaxID=2881337 RepID=UPI001CFF6483|nr:hypothetical protein [Microvirga lenta]MCB5174882.1 hypothetical protein [Microvirga lenta]